MASSATPHQLPAEAEAAIPLISLTPLLSPSTATALPASQSLVSALRSSGFLYLTDSPIPTSLLNRVFSNSASFFSRPQSQKDSLAWTTARSNRGYVCLGREKVSQGATKEEVAADRVGGGEDLKETFEIGREGDEYENLWPDKIDGEGVEFTVTMKEFFDCCRELHRVVMRAIALGMGLEESFFDGYVRKGDNTLRLLHYPPVAKDAFKAGRERAGAHTDYGSVTFLFQDSAGGLQVERPGDDKGVFVDVTPVEGAIVLNSGDLLARWSNDIIRSTLHRVVEPPRKERGHDAGKDGFYPARYSVAYFGNPDFDQWIEALPGTFGGEKGPKKYKGVNSLEYLVDRLSATY
ncbi:hypothetical protein MMC31_003788 [Peltigera leucophlebia]|nr:hypothetical protein [Peltigera leucophlebia]